MEKKSVFKRFLYSQKAAPYVFVLPFVLTFLIFFAYPIVSTIMMSFQKVAGGEATFVGLANYKTLMNPVFYKCLKNSAFYTVVSCAIMLPIPMLLATMLNSKAMKAKGFFRSIMFIPALTSVVVAGVVFRMMFGELEGSFMNQVVGLFGVEPLVWLRRPVTVWITLFVLCLWRWTGVNMMYYLSGLQQIPGDLYESAEIDGANAMQQFRYITLPLLKSTNVYVLTISIFGGMAMFTESYLLFNGNKSPNNVGTTIVGYLYRMGMEQNNIGIGSAIGVVLLLIVMAINVVQLILNGTFKKGE
ncbi:carbohydrate ABC transporter permease [Sporofaciens sp. SGI.106]|uniref:carbohydrate ABC transporter permease n=1 Tax=Sporofaciens sp. SGI.106 TaxID=3420568 RepID=UPI002A997C46|nr:sugar ABC transporter permease [Lachnoclostridium sp.]